MNKRRIIKFRAWIISSKTMINWKQLLEREDRGFNLVETKDRKIMQFTGLLDKNGKEIYEGDLVKNERGEIGEIVFNNGSFVSRYLPPYDWDALEPCDGLLDRQTVIGNIFENPRLLINKTND